MTTTARPVVHLNGTSAAALLDGYREAYSKVREARDALARCAPNGRDYYPAGSEAFPLAAREHAERDAALHGVEHDLLELYNHVEEVTP